MLSSLMYVSIRFNKRGKNPWLAISIKGGFCSSDNCFLICKIANFIRSISPVFIRSNTNVMKSSYV